jgi:hypothetical protein
MRPPIKFLRDATVAAMDLPSVKEQMNKIGVELVPPDDRSWYVSFTPGYLPKLLRCRDFPTSARRRHPVRDNLSGIPGHLLAIRGTGAL